MSMTSSKFFSKISTVIIRIISNHTYSELNYPSLSITLFRIKKKEKINIPQIKITTLKKEVNPFSIKKKTSIHQNCDQLQYQTAPSSVSIEDFEVDFLSDFFPSFLVCMCVCVCRVANLLTSISKKLYQFFDSFQHENCAFFQKNRAKSVLSSSRRCSIFVEEQTIIIICCFISTTHNTSAVRFVHLDNNSYQYALNKQHEIANTVGHVHAYVRYHTRVSW